MTVLQVLAWVCLAGLLSMIVHKGYTDISVIAAQYSGGEFWTELARYALRNLAGGR